MATLVDRDLRAGSARLDRGGDRLGNRVVDAAREDEGDDLGAGINQPVEVPGIRALMRTVLDLPGEAQLVLRLGAGADVAATPRRPVEDVRFEQ